MDYVELHCHSCFSLLDGASSPEALVTRAQALGMPALALTDHDDLGGAVRFAQAGRDAGLAALLGAELTVEVPPLAGGGDDARTHLTLLAESATGYANLATLVTRARLDRPRGEPAVPFELVARHAEGIVALTGCPRGWVPQLLARGDDAGAWRAATLLRDAFGDRLHVECWDHGLSSERALVARLVPIAARLGVPWVVTNDVHYAGPEGRRVHDVLAALRHQRPLDRMGTRLRPNGEWHLKSARAMARRWRQRPEGLRATRQVAERCAFRLEQLRPALPDFPLPPGIGADEYLERLVYQGAAERWGGAHATATDGAWLTPQRRKQLDHELGTIRRLGMAGYFLIVWDIVRFARRHGILCQGRGSAANSAVCFCLGITAVDPIAMQLLFERFLSEGRAEPPDIDLDVAHRERERVLQYVYERYGREHAAMVCEQISWRGRSAVRDAARVLGFSVEQAAALAAFSDRFSAKATAEALRGGGTADPYTQDQPECAPSLEFFAPDSVARRDADKRALRAAEQGDADDADRWLAQALGQQMVGGTEATTRARRVTREARRTGDADRARERAEQARASGRPEYVDRYADDDHVERRNPTTSLVGSTDGTSVLRKAGLDPRDRRVALLADLVEGLHQLPRHRSIHVGGFVLTREPLASVVPIEPASMPGRTVIQWEKDDLDPVGLVKIDILGLGMLTLLQDCLQYIRRTRGVALDLHQLPMDDQAVYDDLCRADTIGLFQVESRAQMNTLPRMQPRCFYDLVVEVALIRPGPIQGDMVHPYLRRRAGLEPVTYPHPTLEPVLRRTLGVPLFQEQGMQVAITAAGFTPAQADELRRAMGHKRSHERMAEIAAQLEAGMARNGIPAETARRIYQQINAFADYGFPESHAASFALLVYASAYLRHYYRAEYTAAILNAQPMGFYSPGTLVEDARRHGVAVRPVDAVRSAWDSTLEVGEGGGPDGTRTSERGGAGRGAGSADERPGGAGGGPDAARTSERSEAGGGPDGKKWSAAGQGGGVTPCPEGPPPARTPNTDRAPAVRLGFRTIRGLGSTTRDKLEHALAGGPFRSIADLVHRTRLDRAALRALAEAGALDPFVAHEPLARRRRAALWEVLRVERGLGGPLFDAAADEPAAPAPLPAMTPYELTEADYRMTALSLNGHPMLHLRPTLQRQGVLTSARLHRARDGDHVVVAGLVICRQRPGTAKGFMFLTLEDETGMVNVVVTPQRFERQATLLARSPLLLVRGTLQVEAGVYNVKGEEFKLLFAPVGAEYAKRHDFH